MKSSNRWTSQRLYIHEDVPRTSIPVFLLLLIYIVIHPCLHIHETAYIAGDLEPKRLDRVGESYCALTDLMHTDKKSLVLYCYIEA
jgi:hypothetical protein